MAQFELLVLPAMLSIAIALAWALILVRDASSKVNKILRITSFFISVISIVLFFISLSYIIDNITLEAPKRIWENPFLWGWVILSISFFVIYLGHLFDHGTPK